MNIIILIILSILSLVFVFTNQSKWFKIGCITYLSSCLGLIWIIKQHLLPIKTITFCLVILILLAVYYICYLQINTLLTIILGLATLSAPCWCYFLAMPYKNQIVYLLAIILLIFSMFKLRQLIHTIGYIFGISAILDIVMLCLVSSMGITLVWTALALFISGLRSPYKS